MIRNAKLIEENDAITPELLASKPQSEGFLGIFMFKSLEGELTRHIYKSETNLH